MSDSAVVQLPSPADLVQKVREIAAANPDFIYRPVKDESGLFPRCSYSRNGQASCLIGQGMAALGVSIEVLEQLDEEGKSVGLIYSGDESQDIQWLDEVQAYQDSQMPWGRAIENADAWIAEHGK